MAIMVTGDTLSDAWLAASECLSGRPQGKDRHLSVSFTAGTLEEQPARRLLDRFRHKGLFSLPFRHLTGR